MVKRKMTDKQRKAFFSRLKGGYRRIQIHHEKKIRDKLKKEHSKLEKKQDLLLKKLDKEEKSAKAHAVIEERIRQNKALKAHIKELQRENFRRTPTGKIVTTAGRELHQAGDAINHWLDKPSTRRTAKRILKNIFD